MIIIWLRILHKAPLLRDVQHSFANDCVWCYYKRKYNSLNKNNISCISDASHVLRIFLIRSEVEETVWDPYVHGFLRFYCSIRRIVERPNRRVCDIHYHFKLTSSLSLSSSRRKYYIVRLLKNKLWMPMWLVVATAIQFSSSSYDDVARVCFRVVS